MKKLLTIALMAAAAWAAEGYKIITKIKIGGEARWDYVAFDSVNRRLYVSHGNSVEVVDPDAGKVVGTIPQLHGVHGIAIANDLNKGFITNGGIQQRHRLRSEDSRQARGAGRGQQPRCRLLRVRRPSASSPSTTVAQTLPPLTPRRTKSSRPSPPPALASSARPMAPATCSSILKTAPSFIRSTPPRGKLPRRSPLAPCEGPSGLAIDVKNKKLFSVCSNKMMAVTDIPTMKVIATPPIGNGPDAAGFDSTLGLAFSSNGQDGTMTIVKLVNGKYEAVDTVTTEPRARTMTVDEKLHRIYLLTADYSTAAAGQKGGRPQPVPDSFHVLVVGK